MATPLGRELALALEHEIPMQIRDSWRRAIQQTDFFKKLITAVRSRKGMDQNPTFEAHIAYSAGQPKKPSYMTGARTIIDILRAAAMIHESEGKHVATSLGESLGTELPTDVPVESTGGKKSTVAAFQLDSVQWKDGARGNTRFVSR